MSDPNIPNATQVPGQPVGYVPLDYAPTRPTSVTVLSIISIVFALLGVICVPLGLTAYFVPAMQQGNPGIAAVKSDTPLFAWVLISNLIGFVMSIVLMAGAIGSLKLMTWARHLMLAYAAISIVVTIVVTIVNTIWLTPVMVQSTVPEAQAIVKWSSYIGAVIGMLFGLTMPVLVLIFFRKPHVVDAFERRLRL